MSSAYGHHSDMSQMPITPGGAPAPGYHPSTMPPMHGYQHHQPHQPQQQHHQQHAHGQPSHHLQHHQIHRQSSRDDGPLQPQAPPATEHQHPDTPTHLLQGTFAEVDEATGWRYTLDVRQQPRRARMCGFGDKDRRPITPPPCVRLIITDMATGKEVDCNGIDFSMFVLNVDLWSEDGTREVNLVRSSTGTPAISSTTPYSYSTLNGSDGSSSSYQQHTLPSSRESAYGQSQSMGYVSDYGVQQGYGQVASNYPPNGAYGPPQQYFPQHGGYRDVPPLASQASMGSFRNGPQSTYGQEQTALTRMALVGGQPQGMFTRNLIGSLAASAFRLSDTNDQIGIWFVLQDLSVRTEGPFRLRFSFVNVGLAGNGGVNQGRAPILASCFSDVFNVYSAKKFPGVCESTALSKTFAAQGIKIPIRKDANIKGGDGENDDYD